MTTAITGFFYNYMSCVEEGRYCEQPKLVLRELSRRRRSTVDEWIAVYESYFSHNFAKEIGAPQLARSSDVDERRIARITQLILYLCAGELIAGSHQPEYMCGYSYGYSAAYVAAGALTSRGLFDHVFPALRTYSADNLSTWTEGSVRSVVLADFENASFGREICQLIETRFRDVRVKDARLPYALQVAGPAELVDELRDKVLRIYPGAARDSTLSIKSDSAHLDAYRYPDTLAKFRVPTYSAPQRDILLHFGEALRKDVVPADGGGALFGAMLAPLSMGNLYRQIACRPSTLVLFGSLRVNRFVFYSCEPGARHAPRFHHWEHLLEGQQEPLDLPWNVRW